MTFWDGQGLPPGATARLARAQASGVATSLLSVPEQVSLDACGFRPVGEVMGCIVEHIGFQGYGGCGLAYYGTNQGFGLYANTAQTITSSSSSGFAGFGPYVDALNAGWGTALRRMLEEAHSLGSDGVIGVRLEERSFENGNREFAALGTAVVSRGTTHLEAPFSTTLSGQDVAKLMQSGWVPASIIVAISVAVRHDDYATRLATQNFAGNVEVPGYSDLVHHVRADARHVLERRTSALGADGAILTENMILRIHEIEVAENHRDHVGEATLVATAISRFADEDLPAPPRMVLSLRPRQELS